jgi:AP-1 complex subunit gamma-1
VKDEHIYTLIHLISASPDQHSYAAHSTYLGFKDNLKQEGLVMFGMWMIGEFGQLLQQPFSDSTLTAQPVGKAELLKVIEEVLENPKTPSKIRDYSLTALIKLSAKLGSEFLSQVNTLISSQMNWPVSEVQQRSLEFQALMDAKFDDKRKELVQAIPLSKRAEQLAQERPQK